MASCPRFGLGRTSAVPPLASGWDDGHPAGASGRRMGRAEPAKGRRRCSADIPRLVDGVQLDQPPTAGPLAQPSGRVPPPATASTSA